MPFDPVALRSEGQRTEGLVLTDLMNVRSLHQAIDALAHEVTGLARQAGDVSAIRRLQNDVDRLRIDAADCDSLRPLAAPRPLEIIPDTPYDEAMWRGVDDEGLGGLHLPGRR